MKDVWNLDRIYKGFEDPAFAADMDTLRALVKQYNAFAEGLESMEALAGLRQGIELEEDFVTLPARLEILHSSTEGSKAYLTIREGKFHQVKRMREAVDNMVTYLKRLTMGSLVLPEDLKAGEYRALTDSEINSLKED